MRYLVIMLCLFSLCDSIAIAQNMPAEKLFRDYCLFQSQDKAVTERVFNSLKQSAEKGNLEALHILGKINFEKENLPVAFSYYKKAADKGYPDALK